MNSKQIEEQVRDFYLQRALPPQRLQALQRQIAEGDMPHGAPSVRFRVRTMMVALSAAAAVGLTLAGVFFYERGGRSLFGAEIAGRTTSAVPTAPGGPDIIAVKLTAQWCRPSQVLSPRVEELKARYGSEQVLFVELDLTDDRSRAQAVSLMSALGIADVWAEQRGVTGELLLVDARRKAVLNKLTRQDDVEAMVAALTKAIDETSG